MAADSTDHPRAGIFAIACQEVVETMPLMNLRLAGTGSAAAARTSVGSAALLFGTSGVAGQLMAPGLAAATMAGWRVLIGGGALVLVASWPVRHRGATRCAARPSWSAHL